MNVFDPGSPEYEAYERQIAAEEALRAGRQETPPTDATEPQATLVRLSDVKPEKIEWLWPGRLPVGKLVVLDGDPGAGKSTMVLDWAARVSTGTPWPDGKANASPAGVVILSAEDGLADTIRPRLDAAEADPSRIVAMTEIVSVDEEGKRHRRPPSLPVDLGHLARAVKDNQARLVIVDVLMAYLSGKVDSHRDQDVRGVLHQLAAIAERYRCTIVVLRHMRKSGGSAIYAGGGSIGIIGAARAAFIAAADPEDETARRRMFACSKINIAAMPRTLGYELVADELHGCARIRWLGEDDRTADQILASIDDKEKAESKSGPNEVEQWLIDWLTEAGGSALANDVIEAAKVAGYTKDQIKKARTGISAESKRTGFGKDAYYTWMLHGSHGSQGSEPSTHGTHSDSMADEELRPEEPPEDEEPSNATRHRVNLDIDPCSVCGKRNLFHGKSIETGVCEACRLVQNEQQQEAA